jgi:long-chain acyl-CoA synthetase
MIISGGVNVFPSEIEAVILGYPNVEDCAVFGIPDEEFDEVIVAALELDPDGSPLDTGDLRAFVARRLARYKVPRRVDIHDRLQREDTGKIYMRPLAVPGPPRDPVAQDGRRRPGGTPTIPPTPAARPVRIGTTR